MAEKVVEMPKPPKPPLKLSPELDALNGMLQLQFMERNAPAKVTDSWQAFLEACAEWELNRV